MRQEERAIQIELCKWCDIVASVDADVGLYIASANGGQRDVRTARWLKATGVRAGVPDLFWPCPRGELAGLWIELKKEGGAKPTQAQRDWHAILRTHGYRVDVCYGLKEAVETLADYFNLRIVF